jgi:hypothetical protein
MVSKRSIVLGNRNVITTQCRRMGRHGQLKKLEGRLRILGAKRYGTACYI